MTEQLSREYLTMLVLDEVDEERTRQHDKWGQQDHPNGTGAEFTVAADNARRACEQAFATGQGAWKHILEEEVREAYAESDAQKLRTELIQVAAVAVAWVEAIDRSVA